MAHPEINLSWVSFVLRANGTQTLAPPARAGVNAENADFFLFSASVRARQRPKLNSGLIMFIDDADQHCANHATQKIFFHTLVVIIADDEDQPFIMRMAVRLKIPLESSLELSHIWCSWDNFPAQLGVPARLGN